MVWSGLSNLSKGPGPGVVGEWSGVVRSGREALTTPGL